HQLQPFYQKDSLPQNEDCHQSVEQLLSYP
ncbi:MAG: hypothetical protein ACI9RU_003197, partial [Litorivivens sp.]